MAVFAVIDKTGFKRWLDARDDGLVDVALALFAPFNFNFVVEEFLSIDNRQAAFFCLRGVYQHPFHRLRSFNHSPCLYKPKNGPTMPKSVTLMRTWGIAGEHGTQTLAN